MATVEQSSYAVARVREAPVTAGPRPRDGKPATGHLLAARADRERVVDVLKGAFAAERLTKDEFDLRVGQALRSRTYADLAAIIADIPSEPADAEPRREPPARRSVNPARRSVNPARRSVNPARRDVKTAGRDVRPTRKGVKAGVCAVIATAPIAVAGSVGGMSTFLLFAVFYFLGVLVVGAHLLLGLHEERFREQLPLLPRQAAALAADRALRTNRRHPAPHRSGSAAHQWRPCVRRHAAASPRR